MVPGSTEYAIPRNSLCSVRNASNLSPLPKDPLTQTAVVIPYEVQGPWHSSTCRVQGSSSKLYLVRCQPQTTVNNNSELRKSNRVYCAARSCQKLPEPALLIILQMEVVTYFTHARSFLTYLVTSNAEM